MNNLLNTDYQILFPENLKKYKNLKCLAKEFEINFKKDVISQLPKLAIYENLEQQSDEVLSELAYQYSIDNWKEILLREIKIDLIKNAIMVHSKKGTKLSIEENLKKLNKPVEIREWWEYGGNPFTFKILVYNLFSASENWIFSLLDTIEKYKNCRSVIEVIEINNSLENEFKLGSFSAKEIEKEFFKNNAITDISNKFKTGLFIIKEIEKEFFRKEPIKNINSMVRVSLLKIIDMEVEYV